MQLKALLLDASVLKDVVCRREEEVGTKKMATLWLRAWRSEPETEADHPECFGKHASFDKLSTKVTAYRLITPFLAINIGTAEPHRNLTGHINHPRPSLVIILSLGTSISTLRPYVHPTICRSTTATERLVRVEEARSYTPERQPARPSAPWEARFLSSAN